MDVFYVYINEWVDEWMNEYQLQVEIKEPNCQSLLSTPFLEQVI